MYFDSCVLGYLMVLLQLKRLCNYGKMIAIGDWVRVQEIMGYFPGISLMITTKTHSG
jgi:hypothetical protein